MGQLTDLFINILYKSKFLQLLLYILDRLEKEKNVIIITYHKIIGKYKGNALFPDFSDIETTAVQFDKQIRYLSEHFDVISFEDFIQQVKIKKPFRRKTAVISFDDSYKDNYINGYPILKKYNVPAIFFIITDALDKKDFIWNDKLHIIQSFYTDEEFLYKIKNSLAYYLKDAFNQSLLNDGIKKFFKDNIDKEGRDVILSKRFDDLTVDCHGLNPSYLYVSLEEIREMLKNGMLIGSHSVSHSDLNNLDSDEIEEEITVSKRSIEKKLDIKVRHFSYPFGSSNDAAIKTLKRNGFESASAVFSRRGEKDYNLFSIKRILISNQSMGRFVLECNGGIKHRIVSLIKGTIL